MQPLEFNCSPKMQLNHKIDLSLFWFTDHHEQHAIGDPGEREGGCRRRVSAAGGGD